MSTLKDKVTALASKAVDKLKDRDAISAELADIIGLINGLEKDAQELIDLEKWENNIILSTDAYKCSHYQLYPDKTEFVYSYIESRGSSRSWKRTQFFGIQAFKKKYLSKPITTEMIDYAEQVITGMGLPFNREGWEYILRVHGGYLPLKIKSVKEGTVLKTRNVLVTVVNTDKECAWLTNYVETALLRAIWYPTTVATLSFHCKLAILQAYVKSSDTDVRAIVSDLSFKLNDFGARGVSSKESSSLGGMGHLINFKGSDNIEAVVAAERFYGASGLIAGSIPAAEHSTVTTWGKDGEAQAYARCLVQYARPGSVLAVVSDSYDLFNAVSEIWGKELKEQVIASGATIVIRPDSGDPLTIPIEVIQILGEKFGYTVNSKGFKVLPSCVRVIQGDGITQETISVILNNLLNAGWSIDNLAFGMGGGMLQMVNRDDLKVAMKCSAIMIDGVWRTVRKEPKTDIGKRSKAGRFSLVETNGEVESLTEYITVPFEGHEDLDSMNVVFEDGKHYNDQHWDEIGLVAHKAALALVGLKVEATV